jgi:glucosyl-dolichyl phosphate glucuronosyltransferase
MGVRISAIVCTFNRAPYLRKALQSLIVQTLSPEQYEILVVDNHSTDNTRQMVQEEFGHLPNLRYLYEPVQGLSQARNMGWRNATGEYVAYLDDDATACPAWLEKMLAAFDTLTPRPGCVGGKIEPLWEIPQPAWLSDALVTYLGAMDRSPTPITSRDELLFFGGNAAYPRALLASVGGFAVGLGRKGTKLLSGEELLLWRRLRDAGHYCYYDPAISIRHHIHAARLTKAYMLRRLYWEGVSEAISNASEHSLSTYRRRRMAGASARQLLRAPKHLAEIIFPTDDPVRFAQNGMALLQIGYILGLMGLAR